MSRFLLDVSISAEGSALVKSITDYLVYVAVRTVICIVQALSPQLCQNWSKSISWLASDVLNLRGDVADENIRKSFPTWSDEQVKRVKRQMWEHLLLMVCEIAHAPRKIHDTNWRNYIRVHERETIARYLLDLRSIVMVSGHFGNFELAGYTAGLLGFPTFAIARELDNPYLDRFINQFRGAKGQFILPKQGSAKLIKDVFDSGNALSLLADQNAGPKGCWVDFMGRPASCHKAIAVFTLAGGAPMLVCYARRVGRMMDFEVGVQGMIDPANMDDSLRGVKQVTQWYNRQLEDLVKRDPHQYWWVHRRWKGEPPQRKRKKKAAA